MGAGGAVVKRSPIQRKTSMKAKGSKPKKRPANPCSWSNRCKTRPTTFVSDEERYCKTHAKEVADRWVGLAVKERDHWTCQSCSRTAHVVEIQYAHVISRGARYIQFELENAMALCKDCHYRYTLKPAQWSVFLAETRPGLHDRMALLEAERQRRGGHVDLAELIREYRARAEVAA